MNPLEIAMGTAVNLPEMAFSNAESSKSLGVLQEENTSLVSKKSAASTHELSMAWPRQCVGRDGAVHWSVPGALDALGQALSRHSPAGTLPPVTERDTEAQRSKVSCPPVPPLGSHRAGIPTRAVWLQSAGPLRSWGPRSQCHCEPPHEPPRGPYGHAGDP